MFTAAETNWFKTDFPKQSWSLPSSKGRPTVSLQQWHFKQLFESHATKSSQRKGKGTALKGFPNQKITSPQRRHECWEKITAMACDKSQWKCQEYTGKKVSSLERKRNFHGDLTWNLFFWYSINLHPWVFPRAPALFTTKVSQLCSEWLIAFPLHHSQLPVEIPPHISNMSWHAQLQRLSTIIHQNSESFTQPQCCKAVSSPRAAVELDEPQRLCRNKLSEKM